PLVPAWLRGLDLNQRPLGYEYKSAVSGYPVILQERRSAANVPRCLMMRRSSSRSTLFRGVMGAKWEQKEETNPSTVGGAGCRALRSRSSEREWALDDRPPARVGQVGVGDTKPRGQLRHGLRPDEIVEFSRVKR